MSQRRSRWNERQAEAVVTELLDRRSFPDDLETDVRDHLKQGDPVRALETVLEDRSRDAVAGE